MLFVKIGFTGFVPVSYFVTEIFIYNKSFDLNLAFKT